MKDTYSNKSLIKTIGKKNVDFSGKANRKKGLFHVIFDPTIKTLTIEYDRTNNTVSIEFGQTDQFVKVNKDNNREIKGRIQLSRTMTPKEKTKAREEWEKEKEYNPDARLFTSVIGNPIKLTTKEEVGNIIGDFFKMCGAPQSGAAIQDADDNFLGTFIRLIRFLYIDKEFRKKNIPESFDIFMEFLNNFVKTNESIFANTYYSDNKELGSKLKKEIKTVWREMPEENEL